MRAIRVRDGAELIELVLAPLADYLLDEDDDVEPLELPEGLAAAALVADMR